LEDLGAKRISNGALIAGDARLSGRGGGDPKGVSAGVDLKAEVGTRKAVTCVRRPSPSQYPKAWFWRLLFLAGRRDGSPCPAGACAWRTLVFSLSLSDSMSKTKLVSFLDVRKSPPSLRLRASGCSRFLVQTRVEKQSREGGLDEGQCGAAWGSGGVLAGGSSLAARGAAEQG
jgi:hypothetical protein